MKKTNRQFYCYKFNTDRLKKFNYDITISFQEAKRNGEIVAIADNQILRTIRQIKHIHYEKEIVEDLYARRNALKKEPANDKNVKELKKVQQQINHLLFFPEYVAIKIDKISHYDYIFQNGFKINGETYRRLSCSAGQARNSTVLMCCESIIEEVKEILNNGRDKTIPIAPSKFNAYFGLYSSATEVVTEPKFVVVPDYNNKVNFKANYLTEYNKDEDDSLELIETEQEMCRTDGMGLISPRLAQKWAIDLGLDYVPAQFVIRQSFLKGLVTVFDFHKFCREKNNGSFSVKTVYGTYADIEDCDLVLSESQFKLWSSYPSLEDYVEKYRANKIFWGVAQYSPKEYDEVSFLNYQFIQTLNLDKDKVEDLCSLFVDWINGVSTDNIDYALLFLTGQNNTENRIREYIKSWNIYWIVALILENNLIHDKYIRSKIYEYIKNNIKRGCLGTIPVYGNFQYILTDPYAYMEAVCGKEPKGLLGENEFYSAYWNRRGVNLVDGMRAPMTHYSEHTLLPLKKNEETEEWYKYCNYGIILNWHGYETFKFSGCDFDGDILLTTNNKTIIENIVDNEYPVIYDVPKPQKIIPTEQDLFRYDKFAMGSIIGQITNKGASAYALLPVLEQHYGKDSVEYQLTQSRLKQTCVAQSKQID